jgi:hypothetical protein
MGYYVIIDLLIIKKYVFFDAIIKYLYLVLCI